MLCLMDPPFRGLVPGGYLLCREGAGPSPPPPQKVPVNSLTKGKKYKRTADPKNSAQNIPLSLPLFLPCPRHPAFPRPSPFFQPTQPGATGADVFPFSAPPLFFITMSLEQAKNALVASFFELSNAAKDAATATVNFYKAAGVDASDSASSLAALSASITGATQAALADLPLDVKANGFVEPKKVEKKLRKRPAPKDEAPVEKQETESAESGSSSPNTAETAPSSAAEPAQAEKPEKAEKPKKRKIERDPNAPKKPLTTYLRFNLSIRDQMKRERIENGLPTYPATELNQIIAERWANLSGPDKEALQKAYESEFEDYKKALETYNATKTAEGGVPIPIPGAPRKTGAKPGPKPGSKKKEAEKPAEKAADKEEKPAEKKEDKKEVKPVEKKETKPAEKKTPATPKEKKKKAKPAPAENSTVANAIAAAAAEVAEEAAKTESSDKSSAPSSQAQQTQQKKKKKKDKDASGEKKKKKAPEGAQSQ